MSDEAEDTGSDSSVDLQAWWTDTGTAAAFLTKLPIDGGAARDLRRLARASRTFPLIGLGVGLAGGIVYAVAHGLSLDPTIAAILAVSATILLTGGLHEDGLADVADGFGGGDDREAKLRIMRDSRIGTFGVIAVVLALAVRIAALSAIGAAEGSSAVIAAMIACHAASRAFIVVVMEREPLARVDGMAATAGRPTQPTALWALGIGVVIALLCESLAAFVALAVGAAIAWIIAWLARRQIGGQTGDVLGTVQQGTEIGMLLALAALA